MSKRNRIILALCSLVGVVTLGSYALHIIRRATGAGEFHRPRFEAIVAEVRHRPLPTCTTCVIEFRLDDFSNPQSLRPWKAEELVQRGEGAGHVWAKWTEDGKLKVVIETRDQGHAGEYGFAFSDVPLKKEPVSSDWYRVDVPGPLYLVREQIDEHWWSVLYNLD